MGSHNPSTCWIVAEIEPFVRPLRVAEKRVTATVVATNVSVSPDRFVVTQIPNVEIIHPCLRETYRVRTAPHPAFHGSVSALRSANENEPFPFSTATCPQVVVLPTVGLRVDGWYFNLSFLLVVGEFSFV